LATKRLGFMSRRGVAEFLSEPDKCPRKVDIALAMDSDTWAKGSQGWFCSFLSSSPYHARHGILVAPTQQNLTKSPALLYFKGGTLSGRTTHVYA
jgi:hypothetical protein